MPKTTETIFALASRQLAPVFSELKDAINRAVSAAEKKRLTGIYQKFIAVLAAFKVKKE